AVFAHSMAWPRIGDAYFDVIRTAARAAEGARVCAAKALPLSSLPDLCLDHLLRLTDDTGIIQHATYSVPARRSGYCVDDNARALIVALQADRLASASDTRRLISTYLGLLHFAQDDAGAFRNFMSYQRTFETAP